MWSMTKSVSNSAMVGNQVAHDVARRNRTDMPPQRLDRGDAALHIRRDLGDWPLRAQEEQIQPKRPHAPLRGMSASCASSIDSSPIATPRARSPRWSRASSMQRLSVGRNSWVARRRSARCRAKTPCVRAARAHRRATCSAVGPRSGSWRRRRRRAHGCLSQAPAGMAKRSG